MKKAWTYYDYCHNPYTPISVSRGRLYSDVLLIDSFKNSKYQKILLLLKRKIISTFNPWNTVWGVKLDKGVLTWELYFYNHHIKDSQMTVSNLLKVLSPYLKMPEFADIDIKSQPYFMFSLDLNDQILESKCIDGVHLYVEGRSGITQGNSYFWGQDGLVFENHYDFFGMPHEAGKFIYNIQQSVVLSRDHRAFLKHDLIRKLMPCHKICVAHKDNKEGIYFSRVNVDQFLYFLEYFSYPKHIVEFVNLQKKKLDHLLYDVAIDCSLGSKGPVFTKSSYYGIF